MAPFRMGAAMKRQCCEGRRRRNEKFATQRNLWDERWTAAARRLSMVPRTESSGNPPGQLSHFSLSEECQQGLAWRITTSQQSQR